MIDIDLSNNKITGAIPMDCNRIQYLDIDLTDSKIASIPSGLCTQTSNWQSGEVRSNDCKALLCDPYSIKTKISPDNDG